MYYQDGTISKGTLATEMLQFGNGADYRVSQTPFGCSHILNSTTQSKKISGLFAFGHGPLSFATLHLSRFSYCLSSATSKRAGYLTLEAGPTTEGGATSSFSLYSNPAFPYLYYVPLEGISVNGEMLKIPESAFTIDMHSGEGGVILDSASSLSYLVEAAYHKLRDLVVHYMSTHSYKLHMIHLPQFGAASTSLTCFEVGRSIERAAALSIHLHFTGGAIIALYKQNVFVPFAGLQCLAFVSIPYGETSIIGARQQQGFGVTFDLKQKRIGFASQRCT